MSEKFYEIPSKLDGWIVLSFILHFLAVLLGFSRYENGTNTYMKIGVSGELFGEPEGIPLPVGGNLLLSDLIAVFYKWAPNFEWYDVANLVFSVLALYCLLRLLVNLSSKKWHRVMLAVVAVGMYMPNLAMYEFTRISMILGISSGLLLIDSNGKSLKFFALLGLAIISMLVRPDGYGLVLVYLLPVFVIMSGIRTVAKLIPVFACYGAVLVLLNVPLNSDDQNYLEMRPYQLTLFDFDVDFKKEFKNYEEELIVRAVQNKFLNDPQHITAGLVSQYVHPLDKKPEKFMDYLEQNTVNSSSLKTLFTTLSPVNSYLPWLLVFLSVFWVTVSERHQYKTLTILYGLGGLISFVIVGIYFKTVSHVLFPSSVCVILGMMVLSKDILTKRFLGVLGSVFFIGGSLLIHEQFNSSDMQQLDAIRQINQHIEQNKSTYVGKTFVYNLQSLIRTNLTVLSSEDHILPNSFSFDNGFLFHSEAYRNASNEIFGSSQSPEILQSILAQSEQFVFVSTTSRLDFLENYFSSMYSTRYNYKVEFQPDVSLSEERIPCLIILSPEDG